MKRILVLLALNSLIYGLALAQSQCPLSENTWSPYRDDYGLIHPCSPEADPATGRRVPCSQNGLLYTSEVTVLMQLWGVPFDHQAVLGMLRSCQKAPGLGLCRDSDSFA